MRISWGVVVVGVVAVSCSEGPSAAPGARVGVSKAEISANIHPAAIQIDGPLAAAPGADLYRDAGTPLNAGATADWVVDALPNAGTGCLGADAVATCVQAGVTGAVGGTGHWAGARIVDGINGSDQDIFLTGGKENDTSTWNVGPGTVGSSKYDLVQAYLANNQTDLFFGMERSGNNGTTAFDFEFNQAQPGSRPDCVQSDKVPCRTTGDVLFTFELQGSGNNGSATPSVFTWDGTTYVLGSAAGVSSSINNSTTTKGGPWGHVDSHGNWVLGNLERFTFAEAVAPLSLLPGVDACGGSAWVQVRTRSSSSATSDLKDTTKIFSYTFLGLVGSAKLTPSCEAGFGFDAGVVDFDGNPVPNATCAWSFSNGQTSNSCSGFLAVPPGTYSATVTVTDPSNVDCAVDVDAGSVAARAVLSVVPVLVPSCSLSFAYDAGVDGGANPANVQLSWTFSGGGTVSPSSSTSRSGTVTVGTGNVEYTGLVQASETRDGLTCTASASTKTRPYAPLSIDLALQAAAPVCPMQSDAVTYGASYSGGNGVYTLTWNGQSCSGNSCTINPADATFCTTQSVSASLADSSGLCSAVTSETENYSKVTTITASDNP